MKKKKEKAIEKILKNSEKLPIEIELTDQKAAKLLFDPTVITGILTFISGVSVGIVSNWLYDIVKDHGKGLKIDNEVVTIERETIKIKIQKKIELCQ